MGIGVSGGLIDTLVLWVILLLILSKLPGGWFFKATDNLATVLGYLLVLFTYQWSVRQWRKEQEWKRKDALMERIRAFNETPGARNAMLMLEPYDRDIPLWDAETPEDRYEHVTRKEVAQALIPWTMLPYVYNRRESAIRESFADFFGRIAHLELYADDDLLGMGDFEHVVRPWADQLNLLLPSDPIRRSVVLYVDAHGSRDRIQKAFERCGLCLEREVPNARTELTREINQRMWIRSQDPLPHGKRWVLVDREADARTLVPDQQEAISENG